jgi:hypothetical protein
MRRRESVNPLTAKFRVSDAVRLAGIVEGREMALLAAGSTFGEKLEKVRHEIGVLGTREWRRLIEAPEG